MEQDAASPRTQERRTPAEVAALLARLSAERFGGGAAGKFRISRKFLRQLARRRKLPDGYIAALAEEMYEAGFVFVDCESYFVVLGQKQLASYRRVTTEAVNRLLSHEHASHPAEAEPRQGRAAREAAERAADGAQGRAQDVAEIR